MSLEGRQIGEYEILTLLGQGGMGAVYMARQTSLDRIVALKTLQSSMAADADYIARFQQEARAAAVLNHPNLVQVYSAGESEGLHWFAMEYVEGESADARLTREGRLDPLEAIAIVMHVATALDYAWRKAALIHRDIKPDNIFLSTDSEVKLGDLGLAKRAGQAQGLTMAGATMGTPLYISPEQAEAIKEVDLRADIYSLGCTLYHMLIGLPPYVSESAMSVMIMHVNTPAPDLRIAWPECPEELAAAVMKMMQKLPGDRQQNYAEVSADLQRAYDVLSGASVSSAKSAKKKKSGDGKKKRGVPAMAWLGAAAAACAAAGALLYFAPWKKDGQITGAGSHVKQPATQIGVKSIVAAKANAAVTPDAGRSLAVTATPHPEATPAPSAPATVAAAVPEPQPSARAPTPETPPSATPKPLTEVEKWFAKVDEQQEEAFQKQVAKPFETGVATLRARYLAAVDAGIARASAAGQLPEALAWRSERQSFEKTGEVAADNPGTSAAMQALRADYRQQFARFYNDRMARAKALHTQYDAVLAQNQVLLTQRELLDDAVLIKTKRAEIALAWLSPPGSPANSDPASNSQSGRPDSAKSSPALVASKDQPFVNSLGMKFVPVAITGGPTNGKRLLFSVWDTRVQDYSEYARAKGVTAVKPRFDQGPTHPAVMVLWDDANSFCEWLTKSERASGKIGARDEYRLPSDHEWSCAVGIGRMEKAETEPSQKSGGVANIYPWGKQWPPPKGAGNYNQKLEVDEFENTSPVGSFAANESGLYDMGGNVWQWCSDWYSPDHKGRVLRGASIGDDLKGFIQSSYRSNGDPDQRRVSFGFRCVLAISGG